MAGIWSVGDGRFALAPFVPLSRSVQRELRAEAEHLETFLADDSSPASD